MKRIHSCLLLLAAMLMPGAAAADELPNIIIIYADDQGYQDLSCFGSPNIKSPNIDRIAMEGCRFTDFYSAYCVCSASRAALMTGCYQPRISMPGVLGPKSKIALHPDEVTIADLLKDRGYATQCVGKWHLGDHPDTLPTSQGFDHYFGYPYSNDMARNKGYGNNSGDLDKIWKEKNWKAYNGELYRDQKVIEQPVNQTTLTDRYGEECLKFITRNARTNKTGYKQQKPFFLYYANSMPHVPLFVSDDRFDPDPGKAYKLTIEHIDAVVGKILKLLDELEIAHDTLVIYTSDNGPWLSKNHHGGSALPLRAGKGTTYEGGMRVPCVMRWPGKIQAGTTCRQVASTIDLLPTIAAITGAAAPQEEIDGLEISALFKNPNASSPHDKVGFFYYRNNTPEAVRMGKWKLRVGGAPRKNRKTGKLARRQAPELYNLEEDIAESNNLASAHPEIVERLTRVIDAYDGDLKANARPAWKAGSK
ncbi:MAG: sulfatase-like hydrolase/transferase [Roseibacillus sp.]|jgi:arylsulfatase A